MPGDWREKKLGDVITLKRGYDLATAARRPGDVPIISSSGTSGFHDTAMVNGPGVVTGRYGTIGEVFYTDENFWPLNTTLYVSDFKGSDPRFVSYYLKTLNFSAYSDKAAVPGINRNDLHEALVLWPSHSEQIAIARVLASLDAKIDLNRQMSATLEDMARALFKSWFVDFDPVHAKAANRDTGLSADIAALFPDGFDDVGLPRGWHRRSLYDFSNVIYGAPFASSRFNSNGIGLPLIRVRDLATHKPAIFTDEEHRAAHVIQPGDIVVGMDGEFRCHIWKGQPSYLNQRVCHFEPLGVTPISFVALAVEAPLAQFERGAVGTTVIHLGKRDLDTVDLIGPGEALMEAFGRAADPLFTRSVAASQQFRQLEQLRDALLPKLLSGELRVNGAADSIAAA